MSGSLGDRLVPCGPVVDPEVASRARERLAEAAAEAGWSDRLDVAWPALAPVFAASPYLFGLARRWPDRLQAILRDSPQDRLADILVQTTALTGGADDARVPLRRLKGELHLLTALAVSIPLGGITVFLMSIALKARANKVVTGAQGLVGEIGIAQTELSPRGKVFVHGEIWDATSASGVSAGQAVVVLGVDGLQLRVEPSAAAQRVVLRIIHVVETLLAESPEMGRPGRVPGTRELVITRTPFIVPYRLRGQTIQILRVYHGARDISKL